MSESCGTQQAGSIVIKLMCSNAHAIFQPASRGSLASNSSPAHMPARDNDWDPAESVYDSEQNVIDALRQSPDRFICAA
jgi:hypothetical protein